MSRLANLLHKFDIRPNVKTYIPNYKKSFIYNFFMEMMTVCLLSICVAVCIVFIEVVFILFIALFNVKIVSDINNINSYSFYYIIGIIFILLFLILFLLYKNNKKKLKNIYLFLVLCFFGIYISAPVVNYLLKYIDTNYEEGVLYIIIISCTYFFILSVLYNIIYIYINNKANYFNKKNNFKINLTYLSMYLILTTLPAVLSYIFLFYKPLLFVFIWGIITFFLVITVLFITMYCITNGVLFMRYYLTIYTDPLFDLKDITHTFISLTYQSPKDLERADKDWYKQIYPSILENGNDEGFFGFGGVEADKKMVFGDIGGKVFENNQYIMNYSYKSNKFEIMNIRGDKTFKTRCILEISKEQYIFILSEIRKELIATNNITPASVINNGKNLSYNLLFQNCVQWVQKHLNNIGIEQLIDTFDIVGKRTVPGVYSKLFQQISKINKIYNKLRKIDKHLNTINGAKALKKWISMFDFTNINLSDTLVVRYKIFWQRLQKTFNNNVNNITGTFYFIYKEGMKLKIMKPENDYIPEDLNELDANKSYNNYVLSKYLNFIFIPDKEYEYIYYKYDYGEVDREYIVALNECYKQVLLGQTINIKYYSQSLNKLHLNQLKAIKCNV